MPFSNPILDCSLRCLFDWIDAAVDLLTARQSSTTHDTTICTSIENAITKSFDNTLV